jgi:GPI-anchor transamidase subunit T
MPATSTRLIASSRFSEIVFRAQNSCSLSRPPQCPARAADMRVRERAIAALAILCACVTVAHARETFVEEVLLQRLPDDVVVAVFTFTQTAPTDARHYTVMSKPLASVLAHSSAHELELSFGRGRWNARRWGTSPVVAKPVGAEVWGTFPNGATDDVNKAWTNATTMLGGIFCASLSALSTSTAVTAPALAFHRWNGDAKAITPVDAIVKHATLPHEAVCVENLAPWLKQLPCRDRSGLGKALKSAYEVFGANHLTFGTKLSRDADTIRVEQTLMMVLPTVGDGFESIIDLLNEAAVESCVVADESYVHVREPQALRTFDLTRGEAAIRAKALQTVSQSPTMFVERFLTGTGNEFGGIVIDIERAVVDMTRLPACTRVRLFQPLPWFVKLYMHTLVVELDGARVSHDDHNVIEGMKFIPAEDRTRSSVLEMQLMMVSSTSTLRIRVNYDKGFLRAHEFPPDANRGFDLPPAQLSIYPSGLWDPVASDVNTPLVAKLQSSPLEVVYMNSLLLSLPTPDFSMIFNVAALTGSVLSVIVVSVVRILIKRPVWTDYIKQKKAQRKRLAKSAPSVFTRVLNKFKHS